MHPSDSADFPFAGSSGSTNAGTQTPALSLYTNPILDEHSPQRQFLTQQGIEVSQDGMAIHLQESAS